MAIAFDPTNRVITLDSLNVSASEMWSRWVDWVVLSDNLKYLPAFSQLGGVAPVALYLFLENGWVVRPQEANGLTKVVGNLLVQGGGNPFIPTTGSFSSQVTLEAPLAAQAINVGSGLSTQQALELTELHEAHYHRRKHDDVANTITIYEVDKTTPKAVFDTNTDLSDITPQ